MSSPTKPYGFMPLIKVLTVSDLHSVKCLYSDLREAVDRYQPDILACAGDILDADATSSDMFPPDECARIISSLPVQKIVFIRGNHEHWNWLDFLKEWRKSGKEIITLHGEAFQHGPLVIVGFPCLLGEETPFRGDRPFLEIDPIPWLREISRRFGPAMRTLWLMHEPPRGTPLAPESGVIAGHYQWRDAIEHFNPLITVFGHDHRTPIRKNLCTARIGETLCINVGQDAPLRSTLLTFHFDSEKPSLPQKIDVYFPRTGERLVLPAMS
jgi:Icc-related predicted phosphoesterase